MQKILGGILSILILISSVGCEENLPTNAKEEYIKDITSLSKGDFDFKYDETSNTLTATYLDYAIINGTLDEYVDKYVKSDLEARNNMLNNGLNGLKESCIKLWNTLKNNQKKYIDDSGIDINIIVKVIEKQSKKDVFIIKDGKVAYDIFDNAYKKEKANQERLEIEGKESKIKYSKIIKEIESMFPQLKVEKILGDSSKDGEKTIYIDIDLLENIDSTLSVCAALVVKKETALKNEGISRVWISVNNKGENSGFLTFELENGTYKPWLNTVK